MTLSINPIPHVRRPAYRRIAEGLRHDILSGKLAPGTRLPSTDELASIWESSSFTIHTALVALVKEGLVERLNGAGTYVAEIKDRFTCVGIYHGIDICSNDNPAFNRTLHSAVLRQVDRLGKGTQIFVDSRPAIEQETVLPSLTEAILHRRIQCLIGTAVTGPNGPALARLAIPTAFAGMPPMPHRVLFDMENLFLEGTRRLTARGCRSAGLITNRSSSLPEPGTNNPQGFRYPFLRACAGQKLSTRDEWLGMPPQTIYKFAQFGYEQFHRLWRLKERPDGLLVYPDGVVMGVITAILEIGVRAVTEQMKFVFHRNTQIDFLCPFPVTWAISDEDLLAKALMEIIRKQFEGEKASPILVPHTFQDAHEPWLPGVDRTASP